LSFFFQAEDGIRAFHVTGVQTCALPILIKTPKVFPSCFPLHLCLLPGSTPPISQVLSHWYVTPASEVYGLTSAFSWPPQAFTLRSEESRVGQDCSSRWQLSHERLRIHAQ